MGRTQLPRIHEWMIFDIYYYLLYLGGGFKYFPYCRGRFPIWLIFFRWVESKPPTSYGAFFKTISFAKPSLACPPGDPSTIVASKGVEEVSFFSIILGEQTITVSFFLNFHHYLGKISNFDCYFSNGLKPPTSQLQMDRWISNHTSPKTPAEIW